MQDYFSVTKRTLLFLFLISFFVLPTNTFAAPAPLFIPSRVSGVAPLAIFFDAASTTDVSTSNPFHELDYSWNFGDDDSATWTYGAQPSVSKKNRAKGPLAAHVFETAGTYTVTLTVVNGTTTVSTSTTITVSNPNTTYSATSTICIATGAVPTAGSEGCPSGALTAQQTNWKTIVDTYKGVNKRILLKGGDTFIFDAAPSNIEKLTGPMEIGSYGTGRAIIQAASGTSAAYLVFDGAVQPNDDFRLNNLEFDINGETAVSMFIPIAGTLDDFLLFNSYIHDAEQGVVFSSDNYDKMFFVENVIQDVIGGSGRNGMFLTGKRITALGNSITGLSQSEHPMRVMGLRKAVISNNTLADAGTTCCGSKSTLAIRPNGSMHSQYVYVSDNKLTVDGYAGLHSETNVTNLLAERNFYISNGTGQSLVTTNGALQTFRNEILVGTGGASFGYDIRDNIDDPGIATDIHIFNNTIYNATSSGSFTGIFMQSNNTSPTNSIKNNLVYSPLFSSTVVNDAGGMATKSSNSSSSLSDPSFISLTPTTVLDFRISSTSYTIGTGTSVPMWSDFSNSVITSSWDIGAFQFATSAPLLTTQSASSVTATGTTLNGTITSTGGASPTIRGFVYGTSTTYTATTSTSGTYATGTYTGTLSSLTCNTLYYYASFATNSIGTSYGNDVTFTTSSCADTTSPSVPASLTFSNVSTSSLTLSWASSTDDTAVTAYRVYRNNTFIATSTAITYTDTGLTLSTLYSYNVSAVDAANNASATSTSVSTTTENYSAPSLTTGSASSITTTTAVLEGIILDIGTTTLRERGIIYGVSTAYGATSTDATSTSFSAGSYTQTISSLVCATLYHYRAYAVNSIGTSTGADATFTTSSCPVASGGGGGGGGGGSYFAPTVTTTSTSTTNVATMTSLVTTNKPVVTTQVPSTQVKPRIKTTIPVWLSFGSEGDDVILLQDILEKRGYLLFTYQTSKGYFGSLTRQALANLQKELGLTPTGSVGPQTSKILSAMLSNSNTPTTPQKVTTPKKVPTPTTSNVLTAKPAAPPTSTVLRLGSKNAEVTTIQKLLAEQTPYIQESDITGTFDSDTEKAVKYFQCMNKIICSGSPSTTGWGAVGPKTLQALKKAAKSL